MEVFTHAQMYGFPKVPAVTLKAIWSRALKGTLRLVKTARFCAASEYVATGVTRSDVLKTPSVPVDVDTAPRTSVTRREFSGTVKGASLDETEGHTSKYRPTLALAPYDAKTGYLSLLNAADFASSIAL